MSNNQKLKSHICNDNCRGPAKSLNCFLCNKLFYPECFGIEQQLMEQLSSDSSFIKFICGLCQANSPKGTPCFSTPNEDAHTDFTADKIESKMESSCNNMNITELNDDCQERIFNHLTLDDLLNLADSSKQFYTAVCSVFQRRFRTATLLITIEDRPIINR